MSTLLVMAATAVIAQIEYAPPETMPRVIQMSDGTVYYAFVEENWRRRDPTVIRIDDPLRLSKQSQSITVGNIVRDYQETLLEWRERHEKAWKDAGYVNLGTRERYRYIAEAEYELALRAHEMAGENEVDVGAAAPVPAANTAPEVPDAAQRPGFLVLWGRHLLVIVAALIAASAALWFFHFREQ